MLVQKVILPIQERQNEEGTKKIEMGAKGHSLAHASWIKFTPAGRCLICRRTLALFPTIKHQSKLEIEDTRL